MARAAEAPQVLALALRTQPAEAKDGRSKKWVMRNPISWISGFQKASDQRLPMDAEDEDDHLGRSSRGGDLPLLDAAPAGVPSAEGKGGEQERYRESMSEMYVRHNLRVLSVHCSPVSPSRPSNAHTSYVPHALDVCGPRSRFAHSTALPLRSLSPPGPFPRRFIEGSSDGENEALRFVLAAKFVTDALEGRAIHTKYGRQELINPSVKERVLSSKM